MRTAAPPATRMNRVRLRRRLERARKGIELLRRKREAIVVELFRRAAPAVDLRERIDAAGARAWSALLEALAIQGEAPLEAIGLPPRDLGLEVESASLWGLPIARVLRRPTLVRTVAERQTAPGATGPAAAAAALAFEELVELLLEAAPEELVLRRLGQALQTTSRQLHTLEQRVVADLEGQLRAVGRTLDEREREERLRLRHLLAVHGRGRGPAGAGA